MARTTEPTSSEAGQHQGVIHDRWVGTDDPMIPPPAPRAMSERAGATAAEAAGGHFAAARDR